MAHILQLSDTFTFVDNRILASLSLRYHLEYYIYFPISQEENKTREAILKIPPSRLYPEIDDTFPHKYSTCLY